MRAPERIWTNFCEANRLHFAYDEPPRHPDDDCKDAYILVTAHEAAVAAARAEGMLAGLLRAAELPAYDGDGDPSGTFDHKVFVKIDAIRAEAALTKIARIGQEWEASK